VVSENRQLTGCALDDTTLRCVPDRAVGEASQPSAAARPKTQEGVFLVWRDTREGVGNIFFKRTDLLGDQEPPELAWYCTDALTAGLRVLWRPEDACVGGKSGAERIVRYHIYHGDDPGGPYANAGTPVIVPFDPGREVQETLIGGFQPPLPGLYYAIVLPEDEAGNLFPAGFDPNEDLWESPDSEGVGWTPQACAPVIDVDCDLRGDRCPSDPALHGSGYYTLGEIAEMEITLENRGPLPATGYEATLIASYGDVRIPNGGFVSVPRLEPWESVTVRAAVRVDTGPPDICGQAADFDLIDQQSDGGTFLFGDAKLRGCDFVIGEASGCPVCAPYPWVAMEGVEVTDICPVNPRGAGSGNLVPEPDERLTFGVTFRNAGDLEAVGFSGEAEVRSGASLLAGASIGPVARLAPGEAHRHEVEVLVTGECGDLLDVDLHDLSSGAGAEVYPDEPGVADRWIGRDPVRVSEGWGDSFEFSVPDGGSTESPGGVRATRAPLVDEARLYASASWEDPDDTVLTLVAPGGATEDVTAAVGAGRTDITGFYNTSGPGRYLLRVRDATSDGNVATEVRSWSISVYDHVADCIPCVPGCADLVFPGITQVGLDGDCALLVSWEAATGEGPVTYDLHRDAGLLVSGLADTSYRDDQVAFGESHSYRVVARDSCADPGPMEVWNEASGVVAVEDSTGPAIGSPGAGVADPANAPCDVLVEGDVTADCAEVSDITLLRDGSDPPVAVVATGISLPYTDAVPGDGTYHYRIRAEDQAGNVTESGTLTVEVQGCAWVCLYRAMVPDRSSIDRAALYQPRDAQGIALAEGVYGGLYRCPVIPGEMDASVIGNGTELIIYQVDVPDGDLRVRREGSDLRLVF